MRSSIKQYVVDNRLRLLTFSALLGGMAFGLVDAASAALGGLIVCDVEPGNLKELHIKMQEAFGAMRDAVARAQDTATNALEEVRKEGSVHAKTSEELKKVGESATALTAKLADMEQKYGVVITKEGELVARMLDVEQKIARRPGNLGGGDIIKTAGLIAAESDEFKACSANPRASKMDPVMVGSFHKAASFDPLTIINATGSNQPLVMSQRVPGIVTPGLRRFTVRDLLPQQRTASNMIEFASELVFTDNAGPQYSAESPGPYQEGVVKNESGITFQLSNQAVTTLAHWVPASRQILSDAPMLQSYIDGRLTYGMKLEEEDELLNGSNASGQLNGLVTQATAFTGGATNQTILDTILKAFLQVSLSEYEATGVVLHPRDWVDILMLKDNDGRYLFGDPHNMTNPMIWGKPVVATQSIAYQTFLVGAFALAAEIWDREDANVRISEHHADFFIRNLVALLAEERLALVVYRATALITGSTSHVG